MTILGHRVIGHRVIDRPFELLGQFKPTPGQGFPRGSTLPVFKTGGFI